MTISNSNFTSDEIQATVQKLVLSAIRLPYDTLGVRRTDITFSDVQQAAGGVFILYPNAPFYVLELGLRRVNDFITTESALLDQLLAAVQAVGRQVLPINDVTPLFNAQAALQELGSAATQRGGIYSDITKAPAYQRFASNVQAFLTGPGQSVKANGAIVQTPQQAKGVIPGLMSQLSQAHADLVARVTSLAGGIDDYNQVNLPSVVISSVLANSASLVGADASALNALDPTSRLTLIRQTVLDLLSTQAVVRTFGSFSGPTDFYTLDGLGTPFSDAQHAATPALLPAHFGGGYAIVAGVSDDLNLTVDGGAPFDILLNPSRIAELDGTADDSAFVIGDGTVQAGTGGGYPNNNKVKVKVNTTTYVATLTSSGPVTAASVTGTGDTSTAGWYGGGGALDGKTLSWLVDGVTTKSLTFVAPANVAAALSQMNFAFNGDPDGLFVTNAGNRFVFTSGHTGSSASLQVQAGSANSVIGLTTGQLVNGTTPTRTADQVAADIQAALPAGVVAEGYYAPLNFHGQLDIPAGTNTTWTLTLPGSSDLVALGVVIGDTANVLSGANAGTFFPITAVTSGSITIQGTTVLQAGATVEIGPLHRRVRIRCSNPAVQVPAETLLTIFGDDTPSTNACTLLGFANGQFSQCLLTTPDQVAADINAKQGAVQASAITVSTVNSLATVHGDTTNPSLVVFAEAAATGNASYVGVVLTYTVTAVTTPGSVSTGDTIAVRNVSPGHGYTIATVNGSAASGHALAVGDVVVASGTFAGTTAAGVTAEFGPTINAAKYETVTIEGGPNNGTYTTLGPGDTAIDVVLFQTSLPVVRSTSSPTSAPIVMTASFGVTLLELASKNTTTASAIVVQGNAAATFFASVPTTQLGTTAWFKLPSIPRGLQAIDILEYCATNYQVITSSWPIINVDTSLSLIEVSPDAAGLLIPDNLSLQFTVQPPPFGRLRVGINNNFTTVQSALTGWLNNTVNQSQYFENLNALINPLLVNANPTAAQIGSATNAILQLYAFLVTTQAQATLGNPAAALQSILQTYTVEPVPPVDTLINTFMEKGSDRAVDLLLSGLFSTFFGLSHESSSYSGAFQGALRDVAMNDLPVRKFSRPETQSSALVAQSPSPDFEYGANSITETIPGPQVDPPTSFGEPSSFGTTTGSKGGV